MNYHVVTQYGRVMTDSKAKALMVARVFTTTFLRPGFVIAEGEITNGTEYVALIAGGEEVECKVGEVHSAQQMQALFDGAEDLDAEKSLVDVLA